MPRIGVLCLLFGLAFGLTGCNPEDKEKPETGSNQLVVLAKPNWTAVENLKSTSDQFRVELTGKAKLNLGDEMVFHVSSSQKGRLWMVQVDPNDEVTFLFPNREGQDNRLLGDKSVKIPPASADWVIEASEPKGESLVVAVVTTEKFDLYKNMGTKSTKKLADILSNAQDWGVGHMVVYVD